MLSWLKNKPIIGLAPIEAWTDSPFRQICKNLGADLVFSEMIPSAGIIHWWGRGERPFAPTSEKPNKFENLLYFTEAERPIAIQIFGKKPDEMTEACSILNEGISTLNQKEYRREKIEESQSRDDPVGLLKPDEININFGCPAKSAVSSGHGVALMDNPDLAAEIVSKCVKSSELPITVKMRTGWSDSSEAVPFAKKMADAGAMAIYIHGRTFKQKYSGLADWNKIYEVAKSVDIPVVGNGDITNQEDRKKKIEDSSELLAGVLIGRAARGNPWIFRRDDPVGRLIEKKIEDRREKIAQGEFMDIILKHAKLIQYLKGEHGIIEFRKHLLAYIHGFPGASALRQKLVQVTSLEQIKDIL